MISYSQSESIGMNPGTVWGLGPTQLHDRYWAARGAQVVRVGGNDRPQPDADLFLLIDADSLILFRIDQIVDTLNWLQPRMLLLRVHDNRDQGYQECIITDDEDRFLRFVRDYSASAANVLRVAVTSDIEVARMWQEAKDARSGWQHLRHSIAQNKRAMASIRGHAYRSDDQDETMCFMRELIQIWTRPDATVGRVARLRGAAWGDKDTTVAIGTQFIGPVWVGTGRNLEQVKSVVGPAVLWDQPEARPAVSPVRWDQIEPAAPTARRVVQPRHLTSFQRTGKRVFDVVLSLLALCVTLPIYPLIMFLIWIEDGAPFFFVHRRETLYGREFPCIKFRSMRRNAEQSKAELSEQNVADGPQFYIKNDPRLTRVGTFLRRLHIDEWPQFFNVLLGQMSLVGPRPSPYDENQYCPAWREARLSVRPGITGMWQVHRSRKHGLDFQEWIRFDVYYVEHMSWKLDLHLIWLTMLEMTKIRRIRSNR